MLCKNLATLCCFCIHFSELFLLVCKFRFQLEFSDPHHSLEWPYWCMRSCSVCSTLTSVERKCSTLNRFTDYNLYIFSLLGVLLVPSCPYQLAAWLTRCVQRTPTTSVATKWRFPSWPESRPSLGCACLSSEWPELPTRRRIVCSREL